MTARYRVANFDLLRITWRSKASRLRRSDNVNYLRAILVLGGIFVVIPVVLFFVLRRLARPLIRAQSATSSVSREVTPTGYIVYGFQVLFAVVCTVAYNLGPQRGLGSLLHSTDGIVAAICVAVFGVTIAEAILKRVGYPLLRFRGDRNT